MIATFLWWCIENIIYLLDDTLYGCKTIPYFICVVWNQVENFEQNLECGKHASDDTLLIFLQSNGIDIMRWKWYNFWHQK